MDHGRVAETVLKAVGGPDNISAAAHCATRLRLVLNDEEKIDQVALDRDADIKGTFAAGGMFQIIVGPGDVNIVFQQLIDRGVREVSKDQAKEVAAEKQNVATRFIKTIADIFVPMLPALIAGGLMMSLNNVLTAEGLVGEESIVQRAPWLTDYAALIQLIASAAFAALPVLIGFSAVKRFGGNPYLGAALGAAMVSDELINAYGAVAAEEAGLMEAWEIFGLHVTQVGYQGQVIPMIAVAWVLAVIEKRLHKWLSGTTDFLVTPLVTMILTGFLAFVVIGPVMRLVSSGITDGILWVYTNGFIFGGLFFGLVYSPIVITGLHQSFPAIELPLIANVAVTGGSFLLPIAAVANVAQGAAALAIFFKSRDEKFRALSGASSASALFGITEPAIFGVNLRLKWPFVCGMIGASVGSAFVALFDLRSQSLGSAGIIGFVSMVPGDIPGLFVCLGISFAVTFTLTYIYASTRGKGDMAAMNEGAPLEDAVPPAAAQAPEPEPGMVDAPVGSGGAPVAVKQKAPAMIAGTKTAVFSPMNGPVVPLGDVPDAGFASGAVGQGAAVDPSDGNVRAPGDGEVIMTFPTGHAIGLRLDSGVEMLIHIGIDTVNMGGKGFTVHVEKGDIVKTGDLLITFDRAEVEAAGYSAITPVLVVNHKKFGEVATIASGSVEAGNELLQVVAKEE